MALWFAGLSLVVVWVVFKSPALDYRLVVAGSLLPLVDAFTGGIWVLHSLAASVVALVVVMLTTRRRRLVRRRWLGVPIGMFLHLVLDGTWAHTEAFWWPFTGAGFDGEVPELARPAGVVAAMEFAGLLALSWWWSRFGLDDDARRRRFLRTGQLDPAVARD